MARKKAPEAPVPATAEVSAAHPGQALPVAAVAAAITGGRVDVKAALAAKLAALNVGAPAPAKKGGTPSVTLDVSVQKMVNGAPASVDGVKLYLEAMKREKDAKREMDDLYGPIAEAAEAARVRLSRAGGELETSVKVNNRLTYVQAHGYTAIPVADAAKVAAIRAIFGEQLYEAYFKTTNEVKIKAEALDDAMLDDLMAVCAKRGVDFASLFEVKQVVTPAQQLTNDRVLRPEVEALFRQAQDAGLIKPKKASLKEAGS